MKFAVLFTIALALYATPVYLLDTQVMPELLSLQNVYGDADGIAERVVTTR